MDTEFEAKFLNIDKDKVRARLATKGAVLVHPEFLQKRVNFDLPGDKRSIHSWIRVRDEQNKVTLAVKMMQGDRIEDQKEICVTVDSFERTIALFEAIGCQKQELQESKRELWNYGAVELMLDEWPGLEPYIEIEGPSEQAVRDAAEALGFDYAQAVFGSAGKVYFMRYEMSIDAITKQFGEIAFDNGKLKALQERTPLRLI